MSNKEEYNKYNQYLKSLLEKNEESFDFTYKVDEKKVEFDKAELNHKKDITTAVDLEKEKIDIGKNLIDRILTSQDKYMARITWYFLIALAVQYLFIGISLFNVKNIEHIKGIVITAIISVTIETIGVVAIIVKHVFSNQIREIIDGVYKHNHYTEKK